jgi:hypothetical protein
LDEAEEAGIQILSQNILHHLAMHIGEAIAATLEFVSKSFVINAQ